VLRTRSQELPKCCQNIARRHTRRYAVALRQALEICSVVRELSLALREDAEGRAAALDCIATARRELERFIDVSSRRSRRASELLRRKFGKGACPACDDEPSLRTAAEQLRWCESALRGPLESPRAQNG
jgi:hypothetical protein